MFYNELLSDLLRQIVSGADCLVVCGSQAYARYFWNELKKLRAIEGQFTVTPSLSVTTDKSRAIFMSADSCARGIRVDKVYIDEVVCNTKVKEYAVFNCIGDYPSSFFRERRFLRKRN